MLSWRTLPRESSFVPACLVSMYRVFRGISDKSGFRSRYGDDITLNRCFDRIVSMLIPIKILNPAAKVPVHAYNDGDAGVDLTSVTALTCLLYTSPSPRDRTRSRMP